MAKGSGSTRASTSNNPAGLNTAPTYRISDIPANQLGYGGLTRDNSTYSKKDRDAYIEKNFDANFATMVADRTSGSVRMGDVLVSATKGPANQYGINKMFYTYSDSYGHTESAEGWSSNPVNTMRAGLEKFLKAWPQRK